MIVAEATVITVPRTEVAVNKMLSEADDVMEELERWEMLTPVTVVPAKR